jgi:hypothetical protein
MRRSKHDSLVLVAPVLADEHDAAEAEAVA